MTSPRSPRSAFLKHITVARDTAKTNIDKICDKLITWCLDRSLMLR